MSDLIFNIYRALASECYKAENPDFLEGNPFEAGGAVEKITSSGGFGCKAVPKAIALILLNILRSGDTKPKIYVDGFQV